MIRSAAAAILLATTITAHAADKTPVKADPAKGKIIAEIICAACHGVDGNSPVSAFPHLAGQIEDYLYKQLTSFKEEEGKPAQRKSDFMPAQIARFAELAEMEEHPEFAGDTDDKHMRNVAAWFASQKHNPPAAEDEAAKPSALGQRLWRQGDHKKGIPACAGCHGPAGAGMPAQYPRLAGQFAEYTAAQLKLFRTEERDNDPEKMMRMIAAKMSDAEIEAVAEYAASLP
ncbi:MAG: c-type cytochrome [Betaproteobacteria bacterium]|nr:c-type cytochrome [Betaproteobacteria bacterium]MCL2886450.1 c-type cytochrome [Betaproteobacteria bacterium]